MIEKIQENISLADYTTLRVGGVAKYFAEVTTVEELQAACQFAKANTDKPLVVIGSGSNILVEDGIHDRLFLKMAVMGVSVISENEEEVLLKVGAGEDWDEVVAYTTNNDWSGFENLSGIPGTIGAAPVQNINAYGASVADAIVEVEVFDTETETIDTLSSEDCNFGYRDSIFKTNTGKYKIILNVTFRLAKQQSAALSYQSSSQSIARILAAKGREVSSSNVREAVLEARKNIGMLAGQYFSAGSFFKNTIITKAQFEKVKEIVSSEYAEKDTAFSPWYWELPDQKIKVSTAFLLECSPFNKNTFGQERIKGVGISPKHSLSIVTDGSSTSESVKNFSEKIITEIENIFSITIEKEVIEIKK